MTLRDVAFLLFPADHAGAGTFVDAAGPWFDRRAGEGSDVVVWCWPGSRRSAAAALSHRIVLAATTGSLRVVPPAGLRMVGRHRLPTRQMGQGGLRSRLRAGLRGGVVLELSTPEAGERVLDRVAVDAGVDHPVRCFHVGGGGSICTRVQVQGAQRLLRIARVGSPGDPTPVAAILEALGEAGVDVAPRLWGHGATAGAAWLLEEALPGAAPDRLEASVVADVAAACSRFPPRLGPVTAPVDDVIKAAELLPSRAGPLRRLAAQVSVAVRGLPGILRHGDLWSGNLLVERGRLSGIIDWDAAHPAGVPGADLLHLVADDDRRRNGRSVGREFAERPWRSEAFQTASAGYWDVLQVEPSSGHLELCGLAWWAVSVSGTLHRFPERTVDERWIEDNVDRVLSLVSP